MLADIIRNLFSIAMCKAFRTLSLTMCMLKPATGVFWLRDSPAGKLGNCKEI